MVTAVFYHRMTDSPNRDIAAHTEPKKDSEFEANFSSLSEDSCKPPKDVSLCNCTAISSCDAILKTQSIKSCEMDSAHRAQAESQQSWPVAFRRPRSQISADFPKLCTVFSLNWRNQNSAEKDCVTDELVNTYFHFLVDMSACFELPQKQLLPLLQMNAHSFMHPRTQAEVKRFLPDVFSELTQSETPSCKRLAQAERINNLQAWLYLAAWYHLKKQGKIDIGLTGLNRSFLSTTVYSELNKENQELYLAATNRLKEAFKPGVCVIEEND